MLLPGGAPGNLRARQRLAVIVGTGTVSAVVGRVVGSPNSGHAQRLD